MYYIVKYYDCCTLQLEQYCCRCCEKLIVFFEKRTMMRPNLNNKIPFHQKYFNIK